MAEPISLASGLVALAAYALKSSITLHDFVKSFGAHNSRVRDLLEEIGALSGVLGSLNETVSASTGFELSSLEWPLLRCGKTCKEFEQELVKCSSRSQGGRTSFRDWARLRYMGDDIDAFRRTLAVYKGTIEIALANANLRKSSMTAESIEACRDMIESTTEDLQDRLESMNEKLDIIAEKLAAGSESDTLEVQSIKDEKLSTEKCLQICAQLAEHIDQIQSAAMRSGSDADTTDSDSTPEMIIHEGLEECKISLTKTAAKLESHLQEVVDRIVTKSAAATASEEDRAELKRMQEHWKTMRQCIDICSKAEGHLKEKDVSVIDNYATGDAIQFMVSTNGKTLIGKNRGLGWRTKQVGGHIDGLSLRQISQDMVTTTLRDFPTNESSSKGISPPATNAGAEDNTSAEFRNRYGRGHPLANEPRTGTPPNLGKPS